MTDIQLFRPQRLTDNPDGGGLATATPIVDGEANNLFDDISRIDRVNGELSLRKVFAIAPTADTELYSDLHMVVKQPPLDPRVSAVLFRAQAWDDQRDAAKNYVERYVDESVVTRMIPYDRQLAGSRAVIVFTRKELALPEVGEVYALKDEVAGVVEYFAIQAIEHEVQTFTDAQGDFEVRVITLTITQPLSMDFSGSQPNRYIERSTTGAAIRRTLTSDAARYKGTVRLAQDAAVGDVSVHLESVFAQLVPAAKSEIPIADAAPSGATVMVASASGRQTLVVTGSSTTVVYAGTAILPGSLEIVADGSNRRFTDRAGLLIETTANDAVCGTVNYVSGRCATNTGLNLGNANVVSVSWTPAAQISASAQSYALPVAANSRGYVYVATLHPVPAPGATTVSFIAQGKRYLLQDDGTGALRGDVGVGVGQVNLQTGSVQVTLGALPDVGSSVVFAYGGVSEFEVRDADVAIAVPAIEFTLGKGNCEPGTLSLQWLAAGEVKTATADAAGSITGAATGRVVHATGQVTLRPAVLPDSNATVTAAYSGATTRTDAFTPAATGTTVQLQLGALPRPGSLAISFACVSASGASVSRRLFDDGQGGLKDEAGAALAGASVNYGTGLVVFDPAFSAQVPAIKRSPSLAWLPMNTLSASTGRYAVGEVGGSWPDGVTNQTQALTFVSGSPVQATYKDNTASDVAIAGEQHAIPALQLDLTPLVRNSVVPGGVLFTFGGKTYADRAGTLYSDVDPQTGAGTASGTVSYATGAATITRWTGGGAPAFDIKALLTAVGLLPVGMLHGMTPGRPLRPGTFYVQATRYRDGAVVSALADNNGNLDAAGVHGVVDVVTGAYSVAFGAWVLDSSLTAADKAEPWYSIENVDSDGYLWRPDEVVPGTISVNCVVQASLPLDPEIIKVNPVRLPLDGRVPVIRPGDTLVIHDTQPYSLPAGLVAGQTVALPRAGLAGVALYDADGLGVPAARFTADLTAGTVTMATPLDLTGYAEPLVALHWVEDMALCLDAQITGEVALSRPLGHAYTAANGLCSSALVLGDAQAHYTSLFTQNTWLNHWVDQREGTAPTSGANFNDASFPLQVLNRDAITQRWALVFTGPSAFNVVGETLGVVGTGTTAADVAPINPATGQPYFRLPASGFGAGWGTGNVVRFNTVAAGAPVWVARTVLSGNAAVQDDRIRIEARWDKG